jgi:ElaB/YqjD/DUF883 family membrane-anchored ribosome-binding protein
VDSELEVIHHQMEGTRASLAEKLDTLETKVLGTVNEATSAVAHTVDDVKSVVGSVTESIQDTVETVKQTFNLKEQVRRHPWGMMGGAAVAGFLGGCLFGPSRRESKAATSAAQPDSRPPPARETRTESSSDNTPGLEVLQHFKGLALGALLGVLRDMAAEALPESWNEEVVKVLDEFTTKIGGKPLPPMKEPGQAEETAEAGETPNGKQESPEAPRSTGASRKEKKEAPNPANRGRGPLP